MFRYLSYLMNTATWFYFILVARTHRSIRRLNFLSEKMTNNQQTQSEFDETSLLQRKEIVDDSDK